MGMNSAAYMDHNATTTLRPEAAAAVRGGLGLTGNPSSVHRFGRLVRRAIEDARDAVAVGIWLASDQGGDSKPRGFIREGNLLTIR